MYNLKDNEKQNMKDFRDYLIELSNELPCEYGLESTRKYIAIEALNYGNGSNEDIVKFFRFLHIHDDYDMFCKEIGHKMVIDAYYNLNLNLF